MNAPNDSVRATLDKFNLVSEQVRREEANIANRIQWMLTFAGLLFISLGLGEGSFLSNSGGWRYVVPFLGLLVSFEALAGVHAANLSKGAYRTWWDSERNTNAAAKQLPLPYGSKADSWHKNTSRLGRISSSGLCLTVSAAWIAVLVIMLLQR